MADRNGYIGRAPSDSSVIIARQVFSPTGVQTDFTFSSGYSVGYLDAYLNGTRLIEGQDYLATNGSVVGLLSAAQEGDILELVAYKAFNVATIDSSSGNFTVNGNLDVDSSITAVSAVYSGIVTASGFVGNVTGSASTASFATTSFGLSGTPNLNVGVVTASFGNFSGIVTATGVVVSGVSTFSGNVNLGDNTDDNINVSGEFISNLIPDATGTYDLGSTTQRWRDIWVSRDSTIARNLTVGGDVLVSGAATFTNLTVNGTQTIINTTSLEVADKTVGIGSTSSPSDSLADGAGIVIYGTTNKTLSYNNTKKALETNVAWATTETRFINVAEKHSITSGNTVNLVYNGGSTNIGLTTNPTGDITLNVTGIPTSSDFDSHTVTFSVFINQTGVARSCTAVTLNGYPVTIRWAGGSLSNAISGVTTTSGMDIYSFTGINTVGSASTTGNYYILGVVNGGYR